MHVQTASLAQFQFYRKQEFYRFLCPNYLTATLNMLQNTNMGPISSHLSKNGVVYYYLMLFPWLQSIKMCLISTKQPYTHIPDTSFLNSIWL